MRFSAVRAHGTLGRKRQPPPAFEDLTELTLMAEAGGFGRCGSANTTRWSTPSRPARCRSWPTWPHGRRRSAWAPAPSSRRSGTRIRVAGECALLDVISNGRVEIGLARGAYQFEFDRMAGGIPPSSGGTHLREMVPAVRELWQGDYAHDGEIWQFPTSTSVPKPIQQPMPPMWIAARDPALPRLRRQERLQRDGHPADEGRRGGRRPQEQVRDRRWPTTRTSPRPELMVLRHTHVHPADEPDGWRRPHRRISRFYRTFDAWFGNKTTPVTASWSRARSRSSRAARSSTWTRCTRRR